MFIATLITAIIATRAVIPLSAKAITPNPA
jgi:hypothetical protein